MSKISCEVCLDLMPLIKDDVASNDSKTLVLEHIAECENCKILYESTCEKNKISSDEKRITKNIRKNILFFTITLLLMGFSWAMILMDTMNKFYNSLIIPAIGLLGYLLLKNKAYYSVLAVALPTFIFDFIYCWNDMGKLNSLIEKIKISAMKGLFYGLIYTFFCCIGVLIGWLFSYAFKKEDKYEN